MPDTEPLTIEIRAVFKEWAVKVHNEKGVFSFECWKLLRSKVKISSEEAKDYNESKQVSFTPFTSIYLPELSESKIGDMITLKEISY